MKIRRKEARDEFNHISRNYTRYLIWTCFAEFCYNYFGDIDKHVEIRKLYNEYLTLKKLNLKEKNQIKHFLFINMYIYLIYILIAPTLST